MNRLLLLLGFFVAACTGLPAQTLEAHLHEAVSGVILSHSTFAHGYRHGYEEGYHLGNSDINMARLARTKTTQFRGLSLGYSPQFGPRRVFETGFQAGLKAGYSDGYFGRTFRAVDALRSVAANMAESPSPADPTNAYFDQGFYSGYHNGFQQGESDNSSVAEMDFHLVGCTQFHPAKQKDLPAQGSYCEGYRRGFALGHTDGVVLRPASALLEASK